MAPDEPEVTQPPPVPTDAAARAWRGLGDAPTKRPSATGTPALRPPTPPVRPSPSPPTRKPSRPRVVAALIGVGLVVVVVAGVLAVRGADDEEPTGETQTTAPQTLGTPAHSTAVTNAPRTGANADEVKNRLPLVAAQLAPLDMRPTTPDAHVAPLPIELPAESTANDWLFAVNQSFAVGGVDPNRPTDAPPGSTALNSVVIDGFATPAGAAAMREAYTNARTSNGYSIVQAGDTATPTRLQRDSNGLLTTTFLYVSTNMLVQFVNVCRLCPPEAVNRDVQPVLVVLQNQFPPP